MILFLDGPAKSVRLTTVRRAPLYLRLAQTPDGKWTALADLDAEPPQECVMFAYRKTGVGSWEWSGEWHEDEHGAMQREMLPGGVYKEVEAPPSQAVMRKADSWRAWTESEVRPY